MSVNRQATLGLFAHLDDILWEGRKLFFANDTVTRQSFQNPIEGEAKLMLTYKGQTFTIYAKDVHVEVG